MTTLAVNTPRTYELGDINELPVIADDIIYEGAAVGENASGYSRPLEAGDAFQGFAIKKADNTDGGAGDINVQVRSRGYIRLTVAGATAITANDFPPVYASDDATFTTTSTSNSLIGNVYRWLASTDCIVQFDTPRPPSSIVEGDIGTGAVTNGKIGADAVNAAKIADDAVSLEHLDSGVTPSHVVKYAGEKTWTGGGTTLAHTVTGAAATDIVVATFHTIGSEGTMIQGAVASTNTVTFTLDTANTSNDAVISYVVYRAAA